MPAVVTTAGTAGGRDVATGALDGLRHRRGLEILCSRHGSSNYGDDGNGNVPKDVGGRYPYYSFICRLVYESYEQDCYSSSAVTTTPACAEHGTQPPPVDPDDDDDGRRRQRQRT
jgi:hypothetical protein